MKNKKIKIISICSLLATAVVFSFALISKNFSFIPGYATDHVCSGNHYNEIKENHEANGCNEYWVCCECHTRYSSTLEIPSYNPNNWTNAGEYQRIDDVNDSRHIGSLFSETITKDGCGFIVNNNTIKGSDTNDGWLVSKNQYYNFSMDVSLDKSSITNPYGDHLITNAIVIGGQINQGVLSGYVIQIDSSFIEVFYLDGANGNYAGNCISYAEGDFKNQTLTISVNQDVLSIACGARYLITGVRLSTYNYYNVTNLYSTSDIIYNGGHIGLFNYGHINDANIRGTTLTVSNFSNKTSPVLQDMFYTNPNWTLSNDKKTVSTGENDGFMLSNKFYNDVNLRVKADKGSIKNIWGDHQAYNSIIIGGKYVDNKLSGYVVEIQNNHYYIGKLTGNNYATGDVINYIGHWTGKGGNEDFLTANKNLFISVEGKVLTISSIDEKGREPLYPSCQITMDDYNGGYIGYISQNEGAHNVLIEEIVAGESNNESVDVINGAWAEGSNSFTTAKGNNLALLKNTTLENGSFSAKMSANGTNNSGLVFSANTNATSYYTLFMTSNGGNQLKLHKVENGTASELATCYVTAGYAYNHEITLTVEFNNGDFKCFFNDKMLHARVDASPLTGNRVGFMSHNNGSIFANYQTSTERNFKTVDTLIIGHSYMELWSNYKTDLSKYSDIHNIGIGGTASNDWIGHRSEIKAYAPNRLIYMIGINDVPRGTSAQGIMNNIKSLINGVMSDLPNTEICLLSINRCVTHEDYKTVIADTNTLLKAYVNEHENLYYGDLDNAFLNNQGNPDSNCFTDGLHPTIDAYKVIANAIYSAFGD